MRVVIVGAGVAGLALAGRLRRPGNEVSVLEAASALRTGGAAISVWNNGAMALRHLGISLDGQGRRIDRLEMRSKKGRPAGIVDARRLSDSLGIDAVTVPRGRLIEHLAARIEPGSIRFAAECTKIDEKNGQAIAYFDGAESIGADLIVGADGHRSVVRNRFAVPGGPTPTGWASLQGLTHTPLQVAEGTTSIYQAGKEGAVGLMPAGRGLLQWWFDVRWPTPDAPNSLRSWLRDRFGGWGSPVREHRLDMASPFGEFAPEGWNGFVYALLPRRLFAW